MNDPFVATPRGFRRKIGPKSKYGMNDNEPAFGDGIGPHGAQSSGNRRSSFTGQTKLGTPFAKQESGFAGRMREAREVAEANKFDRRKPAPATPTAGKAPLENARNGPAPIHTRNETNAMIKTTEQRSARMMDGKPIEEFFNDAAQRQKRDNQYATYDKPGEMRDDMTAEERKRNDDRHERQRQRTAAPQMATSKVPDVKQASPPQRAEPAPKMASPQQPEKSEPKKSGVGGKFAEVRGSLAKQRASYRRIAEERKQRTAAAPARKSGEYVPQSEKNTQGIAAKLERIGPKMKAAEDAAIRYGKAAAGYAYRSLRHAASDIASKVRGQAKKNPHGLLARISG